MIKYTNTPNIKIIATDLDGTLLPQSKTITAHTASVFKALSERGYKLVIATGRPFRAVEEFLQVIPFNAVICHNGAVSRVGGEDFRTHSIPRNTLLTFVATLKSAFPNISMLVESADTMYVNFDVMALWQEANAKAFDFTNLDLEAADKIIVIFDEHTRKEEIFPCLPQDLYMDISYDGSIGYIMHQSARKHLTLAEVAAHFGCTLGEVAAFGDDVNDLEMIRTCGYGVAMANGIEAAKAAARYLTTSNEEDGVAAWLTEHLKISLQR